MRCPNCNQPVEEGERFCVHCGADLRGAESDVAPGQESEESFYDRSDEEPAPVQKDSPKKKKKKSSLFTVTVSICSVCLAIILICGGLLLYQNTDAYKAKKQLELGNRYLEEQNYEEAELHFNKALEYDDSSTDAELGLAEVYTQSNRPEQAGEIVDQISGHNQTLTDEQLARLNDYRRHQHKPELTPAPPNSTTTVVHANTPTPTPRPRPTNTPVPQPQVTETPVPTAPGSWNDPTGDDDGGDAEPIPEPDPDPEPEPIEVTPTPYIDRAAILQEYADQQPDGSIDITISDGDLSAASAEYVGKAVCSAVSGTEASEDQEKAIGTPVLIGAAVSEGIMGFTVDEVETDPAGDQDPMVVRSLEKDLDNGESDRAAQTYYYSTQSCFLTQDKVGMLRLSIGSDDGDGGQCGQIYMEIYDLASLSVNDQESKEDNPASPIETVSAQSADDAGAFVETMRRYGLQDDSGWVEEFLNSCGEAEQEQKEWKEIEDPIQKGLEDKEDIRELAYVNMVQLSSGDIAVTTNNIEQEVEHLLQVADTENIMNEAEEPDPDEEQEEEPAVGETEEEAAEEEPTEEAVEEEPTEEAAEEEPTEEAVEEEPTEEAAEEEPTEEAAEEEPTEEAAEEEPTEEAADEEDIEPEEAGESEESEDDEELEEVGESEDGTEEEPTEEAEEGTEESTEEPEEGVEESTEEPGAEESEEAGETEDRPEEEAEESADEETGETDETEESADEEAEDEEAENEESGAQVPDIIPLEDSTDTPDTPEERADEKSEESADDEEEWPADDVWEDGEWEIIDWVDPDEETESDTAPEEERTDEGQTVEEAPDEDDPWPEDESGEDLWEEDTGEPSAETSENEETEEHQESEESDPFLDEWEDEFDWDVSVEVFPAEGEPEQPQDSSSADPWQDQSTEPDPWQDQSTESDPWQEQNTEQDPYAVPDDPYTENPSDQGTEEMPVEEQPALSAAEILYGYASNLPTTSDFQAGSADSMNGTLYVSVEDVDYDGQEELVEACIRYGSLGFTIYESDGTTAYAAGSDTSSYGFNYGSTDAYRATQVLFRKGNQIGIASYQIGREMNGTYGLFASMELWNIDSGGYASKALDQYWASGFDVNEFMNQLAGQGLSGSWILSGAELDIYNQPDLLYSAENPLESGISDRESVDIEYAVVNAYGSTDYTSLSVR